MQVILAREPTPEASLVRGLCPLDYIANSAANEPRKALKNWYSMIAKSLVMGNHHSI